MTFAPASTASLIVGIASRMRESSVIAPVFLSSGTLKSTRMKTRLPASADPSAPSPDPARSSMKRMPVSFTAQSPFAAIIRATSTMRCEKPISLSYQEKIFAKRSPRTDVIVASNVLDAGDPM